MKKCMTRIKSLDYLKACAILLMLFMHCSPRRDFLHSWIASFFMAIFFIVSGYQLRIRCEQGSQFNKMKEYIIKNLRHFMFLVFFMD